MTLDEIARDAEKYTKAALFELFGNDVETERSKTNVQS